jgi:hypothetical protein
MQATGVLILVNVLFILLALSLQSIGNLYLLIIILSLAFILTYGLNKYAIAKKLARESV